MQAVFGSMNYIPFHIYFSAEEFQQLCESAHRQTGPHSIVFYSKHASPQTLSMEFEPIRSKHFAYQLKQIGTDAQLPNFLFRKNLRSDASMLIMRALNPPAMQRVNAIIEEAKVIRDQRKKPSYKRLEAKIQHEFDLALRPFQLKAAHASWILKQVRHTPLDLVYGDFKVFFHSGANEALKMQLEPLWFLFLETSRSTRYDLPLADYFFWFPPDFIPHSRKYRDEISRLIWYPQYGGKHRLKSLFMLHLWEGDYLRYLRGLQMIPDSKTQDVAHYHWFKPFAIYRTTGEIEPARDALDELELTDGQGLYIAYTLYYLCCLDAKRYEEAQVAYDIAGGGADYYKKQMPEIEINRSKKDLFRQMLRAFEQRIGQTFEPVQLLPETPQAYWEVNKDGNYPGYKSHPLKTFLGQYSEDFLHAWYNSSKTIYSIQEPHWLDLALRNIL